MKKKGLLLIVGLFLLMLAVSPGNAAEEKVDLIVNSYGGAWEQFMRNEIVPAFKKEHPKISKPHQHEERYKKRQLDMGQEGFSHCKKSKLLIQVPLQELQKNWRHEIQPGCAHNYGKPQKPD